MDIRLDDLSGIEIQQVLEAHLHWMTLHSPPESIHALDLDALRKPGIRFWSAWDGDQLLGCIALKELDRQHAEVKSMRTLGQHQRRGVGSRLLGHLLDEARRHGYTRLSLETGSMAAFEPARSLYARFGFRECGPFADYVPDVHSVFMTMEP